MVTSSQLVNSAGAHDGNDYYVYYNEFLPQLKKDWKGTWEVPSLSLKQKCFLFLASAGLLLVMAGLLFNMITGLLR